MLKGTFGMRVKNILHAIRLSRRVFVDNVGMKCSEASKLTGDDNHHRIEYHQLDDGFVLHFANDNRQVYALFFVERCGKLQCNHIDRYDYKGREKEVTEISCRKCGGKSRLLPEAKHSGRCMNCIRPIKHPVEHEVML